MKTQFIGIYYPTEISEGDRNYQLEELETKEDALLFQVNHAKQRPEIYKRVTVTVHLTE